MQANINCPLKNVNTAINIESLSPKQLLGQCIDLATSMLKDLIQHYVDSNHIQYTFTQKIDFTVLANFVLDPSRLQQILQQYITSKDRNVKALAKSWIFQLRYLRNCWAHSESIQLRLAIRAYDTLSLLMEALGGDPNSDLFTKIQFYRKTLTVSQARLWVS